MIPENEIVEILNQKGILRFSTLMVRYHLSANAAMEVVEMYKEKGLIDDKCKPTFERKVTWKPDIKEETEDKEASSVKASKKVSEKKSTVTAKTDTVKKKKVTAAKKTADMKPEKTPSKAKSVTMKKEAVPKPVKPKSVSVLKAEQEKPAEKKTRTRKKMTMSEDIDGQLSLF